MKLIVTPTGFNNLKDLSKTGLNDFIVYLDRLAVKNASAFSLSEFSEVVTFCNEQGHNLYLSINKMLHNRDLDDLDEILASVKEMVFKGLIYTDYAVYTSALALGLTQALYYDGDMLATNSFTASNLNDELVFVSKELYYEEIEEIAAKVSGEVVVQVQGLIGMFHSMRPLVSNYKDYLSTSFDVKSEQNSLYDEERDLYYPILETDDGSFIMGGKEIALIDQLDLLGEIKVGMLKIDGFMQSDDYVLEISKTYLNALNELNHDITAYKSNKAEYIKKVEDIGSRPIDKGFFFKPTLYKVKK